jgi:hypothetical protein
MRNRRMRLRILLIVNTLICIASIGCVQPRYRYGVGRQASFERSIPEREQQNHQSSPITYGGNYPRLDRIESAARVPIDFVKKHMPFKKKREEEKPPEELRKEAISLAQGYLQDNRLANVNIDVRRYEPREQWRRLKANDHISPVVKYTGGSLSVLKYSLLPGRLFGSDEYNPYTNTLSLNSTKPIEALCEAGSAKVHHQQTWPGVYAASQYVPFVPLGHKYQVASDVITYANVSGLSEMEKKLYPHTYADMSSTAVSETFALFPVGTGTTQFVAPFIGGFVADKTGEFVGKTVAKQSETQTRTNTTNLAHPVRRTDGR